MGVAVGTGVGVGLGVAVGTGVGVDEAVGDGDGVGVPGAVTDTSNDNLHFAPHFVPATTPIFVVAAPTTAVASSRN